MIIVYIMIKLGEAELAKYPFLADAGQHLPEYGFTLEQLAQDPDLAVVREKAFNRIYTTTQTGKIYKPSPKGSTALPLEVLSFILAIVLLKQSRANFLIKKFAMQEARGAERFLERDLGQGTTDIQVETTRKIIWDLAHIEISKRDKYFVIAVPDYLHRAVLLHAREWKLINRQVKDGWVYLNPHETVRLIRQELVNYISDKISSAATPPVVSGLQDMVDKLILLNSKFQPQIAYSDKNPPCVQHAIDTLSDGKNLSHAGRFMLATYLLSRGYNVKEIAPYFKNAPDYNESITLYQLNHLAGKSGNNTQYACQSCAKLKSANLCYATSECEGIHNPMQFGVKR